MITELSLVLFTLLTQMAVGLAIVTAANMVIVAVADQGVAVAAGPRAATNDPVLMMADGGVAVTAGPRAASKLPTIWVTVLGLLLVGVVAAFFHLGRPLGFIRMFTNVGSTWLSRELLSFALFGVATAVTFWFTYRNKSATRWLTLLTAVVGVAAVFSTGMTYAAPGLPAIYNGLPLVFFLLTALILGPALGSYFLPADKQRLLTNILSYSPVVALVVYLIVPTIWLSGNTATAMTGQAFLASPIYWLRIVFGLVLPLGTVWRTKSIPVWLPLLLILSELAGRIIFFSLVVSQAATIGG